MPTYLQTKAKYVDGEAVSNDGIRVLTGAGYLGIIVPGADARKSARSTIIVDAATKVQGKPRYED